MDIDKMYIDNLLQLSKSTKVLEQRISLLKDDHNTIDKEINKFKDALELNLSTKELKLKNNLVNKVISENIKKGRNLSKDQLHLFVEYKQNLSFVNKLFLSKKSKLNHFGEHSLKTFKDLNTKIKKEYNENNKQITSGLKKAEAQKKQLEPLEPLNNDLIKLKALLEKETNKEFLKNGLQRDSILSKIIQFLKEYLKTSSSKALNSVIENLTKVKTNMENKVEKNKSKSVKV
ncbi:MAG: hypothetical protein ACPGSD_12210 [Flavobacteriales bacterium]|mgnify:CR=1 FL=1|jgi:hypothetical protein